MKLFLDGIMSKITEIPDFAKEILRSSEKTEDNYTDFVKQDKKVIELIIKDKLESGNYTNEELNVQQFTIFCIHYFIFIIIFILFTHLNHHLLYSSISTIKHIPLHFK